jgi:hypothetical protein
MEKTIKIISVTPKTKRDNSGVYYAVKALDGTKEISGLCFDEKISKVTVPADVLMIITEKDGTTFFNYPRAAGDKGGGKGSPFKKSPEEMAMQTSTMTLAYAKDIAVALINKEQECVNSMEKIALVVKYLHGNLLAMVRDSDKKESDSGELAEINEYIKSRVFDFANECRTRGYVIPEEAEMMMIMRLAGTKDSEGKLHPLTKPYKEFTLTDKKRLVERLESFHAACVAKFDGCPYGSKTEVDKTLIKTCKWCGFCFYGKNFDERR